MLTFISESLSQALPVCGTVVQQCPERESRDIQGGLSSGSYRKAAHHRSPSSGQRGGNGTRVAASTGELPALWGQHNFFGLLLLVPPAEEQPEP